MFFGSLTRKPAKHELGRELEGFIDFNDCIFDTNSEKTTSVKLDFMSTIRKISLKTLKLLFSSVEQVTNFNQIH